MRVFALTLLALTIGCADLASTEEQIPRGTSACGDCAPPALPFDESEDEDEERSSTPLHPDSADDFGPSIRQRSPRFPAPAMRLIEADPAEALDDSTLPPSPVFVAPTTAPVDEEEYAETAETWPDAEQEADGERPDPDPAEEGDGERPAPEEDDAVEEDGEPDADAQEEEDEEQA